MTEQNKAMKGRKKKQKRSHTCRVLLSGDLRAPTKPSHGPSPREIPIGISIRPRRHPSHTHTHTAPSHLPCCPPCRRRWSPWACCCSTPSTRTWSRSWTAASACTASGRRPARSSSARTRAPCAPSSATPATAPTPRSSTRSRRSRSLPPEQLLGLDNVVLVPHVGSDTEETCRAMADLVLANLEAHASDEPLLTPVI
ncbi:DUF4378 domain protein [Zea mays]|uniref:DUF4378 domain protein n=1 Tax=Zea mays TaxID=4577 RepID=A0A1D6FH43_MAIZE|nr:DUF4378 domain protein [Zea mays]